MKAHKYTFAVGISLNRNGTPQRTVTVSANTRTEAIEKAKGRLDRIARKRGDEPPVGWTLRYMLADVYNPGDV